VDVLADIMASTRVGGAIYCRHGHRGVWGLRFAQGNVAGFHYIARGGCWLRREGAPVERLEAGDLVMFPRSVPHDLVSAPGAQARPFEEVPCAVEEASEVVIVCGAFVFESHGPHPIFSLLPERVRLTAQEMAQEPGLEAVLALLNVELEAPQPGGKALVARLLDALFIYALRLWTRTQADAAGVGVLGALRDEAVNRALALMHGQPGEPWTVQGLGRSVGLSRAAFAKRFQVVVGEAPLQYLTRLRMEVACERLRHTDEPLEQLALRVGYADGFSFNRAFRRVVGVPPGHYRSAPTEAPAWQRG
jgi:AraC-like DNA-binding protein